MLVPTLSLLRDANGSAWHRDPLHLRNAKRFVTATEHGSRPLQTHQRSNLPCWTESTSRRLHPPLRSINREIKYNRKN